MNSFKERIKNLSEKQKILLVKQIGVSNSNKSKENNTNKKSIVAYLISDKQVEKEDIHERLKEKLPEYMIPSKYIQMEEFPKLPNGKIDLNSLEIPSESEYATTKKGIEKPINETESKLIKIWEDVLGFSPITVEDNFFEIGGDSILSIQIIAKARKVGIKLAPNQLFENQTISELAKLAKIETKDKEIEKETSGEIPLLPIQHWFFEDHKTDSNYWNLGFLFEAPNNFNVEIFKKSVKHIVRHHDALRFRFTENDGVWSSFIVDSSEVTAVKQFDLSNLDESDIDDFIRSKSIEIQTEINLSESQLFQAIIFNCGRQYKVLLFAHHLIIDNISWQILVSDLDEIYQELEKNEDVSPSLKTTSYKKWGEQLLDFSKTEKFADELKFWKKQKSLERIKTDYPSKLPIKEKTTQTINSIFDESLTNDLLKNANETYNTKPDELLITALMFALEKKSGKKNLCLGLEKNGRQFDKNEIDLSNTIGWFTTYFPILLSIKDSKDTKTGIISVKETLRNIPNDGLGYGVLRYLNKSISLNQKPQVIFNYLGNQNSFESDVLGVGEIAKGTRSENSERYYLLEVNAFIKNNELNIWFTYSKNLFETETIKGLVESFETELRKILEHCMSKDSREYTPSDFREAELNQDDLESLLGQLS